MITVSVESNLPYPIYYPVPYTYISYVHTYIAFAASLLFSYDCWNWKTSSVPSCFYCYTATPRPMIKTFLVLIFSAHFASACSPFFTQHPFSLFLTFIFFLVDDFGPFRAPFPSVFAILCAIDDVMSMTVCGHASTSTGLIYRTNFHQNTFN